MFTFMNKLFSVEKKRTYFNTILPTQNAHKPTVPVCSSGGCVQVQLGKQSGCFFLWTNGSEDERRFVGIMGTIVCDCVSLILILITIYFLVIIIWGFATSQTPSHYKVNKINFHFYLLILSWGGAKPLSSPRPHLVAKLNNWTQYHNKLANS